MRDTSNRKPSADWRANNSEQNSAAQGHTQQSNAIPLLPISDKYVLKQPRRVPWWLLVLFGLALFALAVNALAMAEAQPDLENISAGEFWLTDENGQNVPAQLGQTSEFDVNIKGLLAHVKLRQTFTNPSNSWTEGEYLFPLPEKAVIHRFEMQVGERRIVGKIKEKKAAKKLYNEAKAAGKKVSMLTQQRPNLFTTHIANIAPQESIVVELEYIEQVRYQHGEFQLRLPTTLTPRFLAGNTNGEIRQQLPDEINQQPFNEAEQQPLYEVESKLKPLAFAEDGWQGSDQAISPPFQSSSSASLNSSFSLDASLDMGMALAKVESLYHSISLNKQNKGYQLRLAEGFQLMDRDFVLTWKPAINAMPAAGLFREEINGEHYGLLMVIPPSVGTHQAVGTHQTAAKTSTEKASISKEVIYVIDTSGSMGGPSIRQARQALLRGLERLKSGDSFNIIEFNNSTRQLFPVPLPVNGRNVETAKRYVRQLEAGGGTVMLPALEFALMSHPDFPQQRNDQSLEPSANKVQQVVFITDGAISNEQQLMTLVHQKLGGKKLFTVGIGSAPNSYFMRKMAEFGRGTFTHIGNVNEVEAKVSKLFQQLESPQMTNIQLHWPTGVNVEQFPQRIPDLYQGEPLVMVFKANSEKGDIRVEGVLADQPWDQTLQWAELPKEQQTVGVAKRWVREKIESILDQKANGVAEDSIRQQVLPLALSHQVMSPFTRFIAVDDVVSRPQTETINKQRIANALPKGSQLKSMSYPNTSTGSNLLISMGLISLSVFIFLLIFGNQVRGQYWFMVGVQPLLSQKAASSMSSTREGVSL